MSGAVVLAEWSCQKFLWTFYMRTCSKRNTNQVLRDEQSILGEEFYRVDHAVCCGKKICVPRMLTHNLFAVANLLV